MAKLTADQQELRLRLCAHLRRLMATRELKTQRALAKKLEVDEGHVSALLSHETVIGLDLAVAMHRAFDVDLSHLCDDDPDVKFYPPGYHPGYYTGHTAASPPSADVSSMARSRRRKAGGR